MIPLRRTSKQPVPASGPDVSQMPQGLQMMGLLGALAASFGLPLNLPAHMRAAGPDTGALSARPVRPTLLRMLPEAPAVGDLLQPASMPLAIAAGPHDPDLRAADDPARLPAPLALPLPPAEPMGPAPLGPESHGRAHAPNVALEGRNSGEAPPDLAALQVDLASLREEEAEERRRSNAEAKRAAGPPKAVQAKAAGPRKKPGAAASALPASTKRPAAAVASIKRPAAAKGKKQATLKLGCRRCRGSQNGCSQCKNPNYNGARLTRAEWNDLAAEEGLK